MSLESKHLWDWEDSHCYAQPKVSLSLTSTVLLFCVSVASLHVSTVVIISHIVFVGVVGNGSVSKPIITFFFYPYLLISL